MRTLFLTLGWTILSSASSFPEAYRPFWAVAACLLSAVLAGGLMEWWCIPQVPHRPLCLPGLRVLFFREAFLRFSTPGYVCLIAACLGYCHSAIAVLILLAGLLLEFVLYHKRSNRREST